MQAHHIDLFDKAKLTESYRENGFVLVNGTMSPQELTEIDHDLKKINRGDYDTDAIEPVDWPLDDDRLLGRHMYIGMPHVLSDTIARFINHPKLVSVLDHIVGAFVPFWDGGYKCIQTMFVSKGPNGKGSPWHQDEHPIPTRDRSLTGVWIPTTDVEVENGCLWIVPDSHKSGVIYDRFDHNNPDVDHKAEARGFDDSGAIPLPMKAGDVLFFSGYLLHSSKPNRRTGTYRPSLTLHYTSATTILSWHGEWNYTGGIPIRGKDPYAENGYSVPAPWANTAEESNRLKV